MARREPNRIRRVARAFREGQPMPQVDAAKALSASRVHPLYAWADASGWVHVVMMGKRGRKQLASFNRAGLVRLARMIAFTTIEMDFNEDIKPTDLVDIVTRNVVPSKWLSKMEEG